MRGGDRPKLSNFDQIKRKVGSVSYMEVKEKTL